MKKTLSLLLVVLMLALALMGCAKTPDAPSVKDLPAADIYAALEEKHEFPFLMAMDDDVISEFYGVDLSKLADKAVMMPMMNVKATEVAIFKLNDAADAAAFEEACRNRAESVAANFEFYLEDQYEAAKNPEIKTIGNYVVMIICEIAPDMMATVEATLAP